MLRVDRNKVKRSYSRSSLMRCAWQYSRYNGRSALCPRDHPSCHRAVTAAADLSLTIHALAHALCLIPPVSTVSALLLLRTLAHARAHPRINALQQAINIAHSNTKSVTERTEVCDFLARFPLFWLL